jgi:hypothetical protein
MNRCHGLREYLCARVRGGARERTCGGARGVGTKCARGRSVRTQAHACYVTGVRVRVSVYAAGRPPQDALEARVERQGILLQVVVQLV